MRRDSIDDAAAEIAEDIVDDLPAGPAEVREKLPDDIEQLPEQTTEDTETTDEVSLHSIFSDTPLAKYLE